jgi:hypothetical protein
MNTKWYLLQELYLYTAIYINMKRPHLIYAWVSSTIVAQSRTWLSVFLRLNAVHLFIQNNKQIIVIYTNLSSRIWLFLWPIFYPQLPPKLSRLSAIPAKTLTTESVPDWVCVVYRRSLAGWTVAHKNIAYSRENLRCLSRAPDRFWSDQPITFNQIQALKPIKWSFMIITKIALSR